MTPQFEENLRNLLLVGGEVVTHHVSPRRCAMGLTIPDVELVWDLFLAEGVAEGGIVVEERVLGTDRQHDPHVAEAGEELLVGHVRDEVAGGVEVDFFVVVAAEEVGEMGDLKGQVVSATEGDHFAEDVRMAEGDVDGMEGPETAPVGHQARMVVLRFRKRQDLVEDIRFVELVPLDAGMRRVMRGIERVRVGAVDAE
jgi:hypothetical protein